MAACVLGLPPPRRLTLAPLGPCLVRHPPLRASDAPASSPAAPKTPADCYRKDLSYRRRSWKPGRRPEIKRQETAVSPQPLAARSFLPREQPQERPLCRTRGTAGPRPSRTASKHVTEITDWVTTAAGFRRVADDAKGQRREHDRG